MNNPSDSFARELADGPELGLPAPATDTPMVTVSACLPLDSSRQELMDEAVKHLMVRWRSVLDKLADT